MTRASVETTAVEVTQRRFDSAKSFDAAKSALLAHMGTIRPDEMFRLVASAQSAEDFERDLAPCIGESGFTLLAEIDHSRWLPLYGIKRKATRLIFGNPIIAITMIKHDLAASLFAPVELLLFENEQGDGCTILYDVPSSLMQAKRSPRLLEAAQALDAKMEALVVRAAEEN